MADRFSPQAALRGEPSYIWRSGQDRRLHKIREWVDLHGRILDNGCGLGTYLDAFAAYSNQRFGLEVEAGRAVQALPAATGIAQAVGEQLPFASDTFDLIFSNEVIEHVRDDARYAAEMVRVAKPGGQILLFCPNRWYPVEQHGIFWRGQYKFGNIPLVNYLPNSLRTGLAPHVRTYTRRSLFALFHPLPVRFVHHERLFGGYDNIQYRWPRAGRLIKKVLYSAEKTPIAALGLSHLLVLQKQS
ncbi:MAG: methyltransferase domain-containing protein [Chloroflexi bacterium]|jgi:SAM-dependent methyltransferase|nr:methyltransferase domain-containing protein [Chloroflexota bacterium]